MSYVHQVLSEGIAAKLADDRGAGDVARLQQILVLLVAWLKRGKDKTREELQDAFDLGPREVAGLLRLEPEDAALKDALGKRRLPNTKTWAKCAAGLLVAYEPGIGVQDAALWTGEKCLDRIGVFATQQSVGPDERKRQLNRFNRLTYPSHRRIKLSSTRFSSGLRERLEEFYVDAKRLTVDQLRVVEESRRHRTLWVEGPVGSGKTMVAMEIAHQLLRSGGSCGIVYRSSQLGVIAEYALGDFESRLLLFPTHHGLDISGIVGSGHLDLLIFDDYSTLGLEGEEDLVSVSEALPRTIVFSVPDRTNDAIAFPYTKYLVKTGFPDKLKRAVSYAQVPEEEARMEEQLTLRNLGISADGDVIESQGDFVFDVFWGVAGQDMTRPSTGALGLSVVSHAVGCPPGFARVALAGNLRSSSEIIRYGEEIADSDWKEAVDDQGRVTTIATSWETLDAVVRGAVKELLKVFEPWQVRILVDPHLLSLGQRVYSHEWVDPLYPLAEAILRVGSVSAQRLDDGGGGSIQEVIAGVSARGTHIVWTDGATGGVVRLARAGLSAPRELTRDQTDDPSEGRGGVPPEFLTNRRNIVLLYPTQLCIGLESDAVIYVRSGDDAFSWYGTETRYLESLRRVRNRHHALAISRARFHLVDIAVS